MTKTRDLADPFRGWAPMRQSSPNIWKGKPSCEWGSVCEAQSQSKTGI